MTKVKSVFLFLAVAVFAIAASASPIEFCTGSTINGHTSGNSWTTGGISVTTAPGNPQCKTKSYTDPVSGSVSGLGVTGATSGEIDHQETVTLDFGGSVNLASFEIIVFYNGPEFGDPREKGFIDVWFASGGGPVQYYFYADAPPATTTLTKNFGGTYTNLSPMNDNGAGWFRFDNPFGDNNITKIRFTAANNPTASNNSDYALKSVLFTPGATEEIPEPSTYALMGLGLLAVGFLKRRMA